MTHITVKRAAVAAIILGLATAGAARAQATTEPESKWSAEFGLGWDKRHQRQHQARAGTGRSTTRSSSSPRTRTTTFTAPAFSSAIRRRLPLQPDTEARVTFTFQSLDADFHHADGRHRTSNLYGQYTDYQTFGIDFGLRRYATLRPKLRAYGEGTIGIGFVDKTDVTLMAPGANLVTQANDFYDQTAAFTLGVNVGIDVQSGKHVGYFGQLGPALRRRHDRGSTTSSARASTTSTTRARAGRCRSSSASTIASSDAGVPSALPVLLFGARREP
jgi:hypothetical protein